MEDFADLKYDYIKLEADLSVTWTVSDTFKNCIITLERKCWRNEQYSRRGGLEIPGIPNGTPDSQLEDKVREVFDKIDSAVKSKNIEACHWIKSKHGGRGVIIKLSKQKDTDRIRKNKKKLKSTNLSSLNVQGPVYINNSLCSYYKSLWSKCKSLPYSNFIHSFWVTNSSIRIKVTESSQSQEVSHICDLEELFPGNHCLADMSNWEWSHCFPFCWVKGYLCCNTIFCCKVALDA